MIFLAEQRKLLFDNKDLVRFLQVKRGDELNFSIDISLEEENLSYQFTAKEMGQYSENPILLFSGVAVGKKAEFTLEANTVQLDNLFVNDEKQIELMCEFAVWRDEGILKSLNEITLTVFNKITGHGEVDENGGEYPPASELVTFSEMTEEVSRQIEELGAHTSIENVAGALKLSSELKIEPETKTISFAESIESKSSWDFSGEIKRTTKEEPENGDLMNLEMLKKALEEAGSHTSIGGVSGEINLSDGLEIDSETKTMGIGNASVQSLTIADGGITQDIDVSLGGKEFFIGKTTTPVTGSNYYFAYQFSHGGAYLQAKRIDSGGGIYSATVAIMGNVNFFDGTFNISNRITSFTCGAPFTQNGISTFNGIASFNNDVTRKTKLSPLAEDVMNKQMVDTAIADAGGHTTIDGVAGDILLSDGITIDPNTKTLGLGDIVADSVNLPNADSTVTLNGSILSGSHGVKDIALLNEYGIGLISSVPEYNQLAIGGDKVLDMGYGRCVDRLSLLALGCGINLMPGGIFVNGAMWKGTSGTKGRYLASKENESVSGNWTFNANVIFNSSISNITGVYQTGKGTKIRLGDYVEAPTVADAGKRFLEITNQSSASLATEFSTKVVTSTGSFSSETYSVFKDSFLEGNSITANVNLLVKGASTLRGVSTFNGAVIANAGLTNTTGTFLLPNKQNRFGQYVENPTIDDASKGWLMLEHSVNTGIDVTLYAEYVSSTGSVAGGQIRFGSAVVCNTSLLVFDNADFRSTLRVGGDIRALAGNIVTPMSTTPTRIGDYVANPSTADAGKLWIEIAKKDGYIELSGKEVVNTDGAVSVQECPVRIPGMISYEELTEAEFAALPRPLPGDVIYRTTQN